ncbi:LPS assembly lipoprotein LptE [Agrobacterium sp. rho-13.3]|uniref:LPS assembly lipoprotein LptE n=1 Tax=Agrobacterium sp. rho-13.3 TaxID=3072980 RepID=UPI002A15F991|nr:LPS assembly lipoprotein LptE [Agrobacterium sp. rho-13.3]MDX8310686.1 LPS assembly lipoprotein LptE [Agrobacterium sp. rho-13.3]
MLSDAYSRWGRLAAAISVVLFAGLLAGCQVRPLYGEASGTRQKLETVNFASANDRITQEVRNHLVFLTYGGAGAPATKDYEVKLIVKSSATSTEVTNDTSLSVAKNNYDGPFPGRVTMTGKYVLTRISDGQVLRAATRVVTAMLDLPQQEFAKIRAIRDGENRAARELAEIIRTDIAATLSR